jgi:hypothetical protein
MELVVSSAMRGVDDLRAHLDSLRPGDYFALLAYVTAVVHSRCISVRTFRDGLNRLLETVERALT